MITFGKIGLLAVFLALVTSLFTSSRPEKLDVNALPPSVAVDLGDGVSMEFILIRPGSFEMGTNTHEPDEGASRQVTLTSPYYLGKFEVTQAQWEKITGSNPSHFQGPRHPVENVSWLDCQRFLESLEKKTGRRFALPTDAQWEYACRAGTKTEYGHGDSPTELGEYAWYAENSGLTTHPVGERKPNAWGLYDMHGNVYEWCSDWYSEGPYPKKDAKNPRGPSEGRRRILRGGGWIFVADNLRSSDRGFSPPDMRTNEYGFRCVMLVGEEPDDDKTQSPAGPATKQKAHADGRDSLAETIERAIADADRLGAEFLMKNFIKQHGEDKRVPAWQSQIAALSYPPETVTIRIGEGVLMEFVLIAPGTFVMGSDQAESLHEKPAHTVTITRPFYLGKYEVTHRQWNALMTRNDSAFFAEANRSIAGDLPVETVSWPLSQNFLAKLNEAVPGGGFRLPTEAEWEYACRAGSVGERHFTEGRLIDYAWYGENSAGKTHPVGQRKPNAWGLYDMYGNVWEWCADRFGGYPDGPVIDPVGPLVADSAGARVARGGGWNNLGKYVNSTFRHDAMAAAMTRYYGFRCVASVTLAVKDRKR